MKHTHKSREASAKRIKPAQPATPISDEISQWYDSRRLTEEDVDHLAEIYSEGRVYNRNTRTSSHE